MTTFKPINKNDIPEIVSMMSAFYAIDGYPINIENSSNLFNQFISDQNLGRAWLIESNNEIAGYLILTFVFSFEYGGKIAFVDELYIKESFRGKGIGKASIDFIKLEAAKLSLKLLYLEVEQHNTNAQKLYIAGGFLQHKRNLMQIKIK